ncbi:MAG: glutamine amidotransferase [Acidobacteriota bacterium]
MNEVLERTSLIFEVGATRAWLYGVPGVILLSVLGILSVPSLSRRRQAVLRVLRVLLAITLVLLALRPALRKERLSVSAAPLAVLVDASGSMGVKDQGDGTSRLDGLAAWTAEHEDELAELAEGAVVDLFAVTDGGLRAIDLTELREGKLEAAGATDLASALDALAERYAGGRRPAVLLLSDGADRGPLAEAVAAGAALEELGPGLSKDGGPIWAVAPSSGGFADLAVDLAAHDPVAFLRTEMTVRLRVRSRGLGRLSVPVSLFSGDELLQVKSVDLPPSPAEVELTFVLEPVEVGEASFRVSVPRRSGEAVVSNNEVRFPVRVVRDRIRVLQVVGRPSWDGRFLRELFKRDPAVDLISFFILRSAWDSPEADVHELSLIPFPVDELFGQKLDGFDLIVFQNFNFRPYRIERHLGQVRRHVEERGGGLLVVGGDLAFAADYLGEDLQSVLPVQLARPARWSSDEVRFRPTEVGKRHPVLSPWGGTDPTPWLSELLPLSGIQTGFGLPPGAEVLLETADSDRSPLLVAAERGKGRSLALLSDGSWRWSLPMASGGGNVRSYERFWRQAIRWLIRDERSSLVVLETERRRLSPGESAEVRVHVREDDYSPRPGAEVALRLVGPTGEQLEAATATTEEDGIARWTVLPKNPGLHVVWARVGDREVGPLHLERVDPAGELADAAVNLELLESLSEHAEGEASETGDGFPDLRRLRQERRSRVEAASLHPLWSTWWAFGLLAVGLSFEWWLRRRWGLA